MTMQPNLNDSKMQNLASSSETDTFPLHSDSSPHIERILNQEQSIVTQPLGSHHEVPPDLELESDTEKKKNDDCCCAPYVIDDLDIFILCRCMAWCCVQIGECTENCCEGCAECISACCESNGEVNSGDGCGDAGCDCDCNCFD